MGRWLAIALVVTVGTVVVDGTLVLVQNLRRPRPPRLPVLFASAPAIQELQAIAAEYPADPELHLRLGQAYLKDGHFLAAVGSLAEALRLKGPEAPIRRALAECYANLDRDEEALIQIERLVQVEPRELGHRLRLAGQYAALGQKKLAFDALNAIDVDHESAFSLEQLALAYGELKNWPCSFDRARQALSKGRDSDLAHWIAGRALLRMNRPREAGPHIAYVFARHSDDASLQYLRIQTLMAAPAEHEAEIQKLLQSVAKSTSAYTGEASFALGLRYERDKKYIKAAKAFMSAYHVGTKSQEALWHASPNFLRGGNREDGYYARGLFFENINRFFEALAEYDKLTKMHSCCQTGFMHVSRVQSKMGKPRAALATLQSAAKLPQAPPKLYADLARAYGAVKDLKRQAEMWQEFIRHDASNADLGYQNLGTLAETAGQIEEAERLYRKCVELQPDADLHRLRLARLLIQYRSEPGRLPEAVKHLERAVTLAPNRDNYFQLGIAYRYSGRMQEAIFALQHAIDLDPGDGEAYQPLGEILVATGRKKQGREMLVLFRRYREFHQAWETLTARIKGNPHDLEAKQRLAAFYERAGAKINAVDEYASVLQSRPSDLHARTRLAALQRELGQGGADLVDPSAAVTARRSAVER